MTEPTSLRALLERLASERVIRLDPRLALQVEALLAARSHEDPRALAAAIASLCTHTPERWRAVHRRCLEFFAASAGGHNAGIPGVAPELPPGDLRTVLQPEPPSKPPSRRALFLAAGLGLGGLAIVIVVLLRPTPPAPETPPNDASTSSAGGAPGSATDAESPTTGTPATVPPDAGSTSPGIDATTAEPADPDRRPPRPQPEPKRPGHLIRDPLPSPLSSALLGLLGSILLLLLGARWLATPALRRLRLRAQRAQLRTQSRGSHVIYHVPRHLPFSGEIIDAAATMLGQVPGREAGSELDVDATIDATSRAVGRLVPIMQPGLIRRDLVILVQSGKNGAHPMLGPVDAILDRWRRAGLTYARHDFQAQIENLLTHPQRIPVALDSLARRSEGCPLLVIAYSTELVDKHGASTWLRHLQSWPVRVLLDLDPRRDDELTGPQHRDALASRRAIDRAGLRRFSFTGEGLDGLARYVGSGGRVQMAPDDPGLRPLPQIAAPLAKWASCLACVPDPSWDQLEDFRRRFNRDFFGGLLDDPRYVWRLLEWLRREKHVPQPIGPDGRSIEISDEILTEILVELKCNDIATGERLEDAAHARILEQLAGAAPTTDYDRGRRALKQIEHQALLSTASPGPGGPSLGDFVGTPFELDVLRLARLTEQRFAGAGQPPPAWVLEALQAARHEGVSTGDLLGTWRRAPWLGLGGVAGIGTWLAWGGWSFGGTASLTLSAVGGAVTLSSLGGLAVLRRRGLPVADDERTQLLAGVPVGPPSSPPQLQDVAGEPEVDASTDAWEDEATELTPRERYALARSQPPPPSLGGLDDRPTGEAFGIVHVALADAAPMVFIGLSGGTFTMGSREGDPQARGNERPHRSHVSAFAIAATPVTQAHYEAVMGENPSHFKGANHPVDSISWEDAVKFCNALSDREGLRRCYHKVPDGWRWDLDADGYRWRWDRDADGYRLPTEAEWEFACRAGTTTPYGVVSLGDPLSEYAWFSENSDATTHEVAVKRRNSWGLHDMHGNVWEWCWDWHGEYDADITRAYNCDGPENGEVRVLRGGSFADVPVDLRSAYRYGDVVTFWGRVLGFRCVRAPHPSLGH